MGGVESLVAVAAAAVARAYVTMGEMCDALRDACGTWRETPVFSA